MNKIDYCSIDIEGVELQILSSIDFDKISIAAFSIENNIKILQLEIFLNQKATIVI
jgi:hypothetical protein